VRISLLPALLDLGGGEHARWRSASGGRSAARRMRAPTAARARQTAGVSAPLRSVAARCALSVECPWSELTSARRNGACSSTTTGWRRPGLPRSNLLLHLRRGQDVGQRDWSATSAHEQRFQRPMLRCDTSTSQSEAKSMYLRGYRAQI
jgi:hypothetical protein